MADISYTRTTWADGQEGGTAIDATKLNNIEQGIVDAVAAIGPNDTTEDGTLKAQIDQNTSDISDLQDSVYKKTYTIATETNSYVSPFGAYNGTDITNDMAQYGVLIGIFVETNTSTNPAIAVLIGHNLTVYSRNAASIAVSVAYKK